MLANIQKRPKVDPKGEEAIIDVNISHVPPSKTLAVKGEAAARAFTQQSRSRVHTHTTRDLELLGAESLHSGQLR